MKTQHTPTPYEYSGIYEMGGKKFYRITAQSPLGFGTGKLVALLPILEDGVDNLIFIKNAINSNADLVNALQAVQRDIKKSLGTLCTQTEKQVTEALAKAEGKGE